MRCTSCGNDLDEHVFPGGTVRCGRCGTTTVIAAGGPRPHASRYPEDIQDQSASPPTGSRRSPGPLCPPCAGNLDEANGSDLSCHDCGGVFVEHTDLAVRIDSERPKQPPSVRLRRAPWRPPEPTVRYGRCPACGDMMSRMNFGRHSGIIVDVCREHGTWFDQGELESVLDFVRAGGLEADAVDRPGAAMDADDRRVVRALEAELKLEAQREKRSVERAAQIADDLLLVLFGFSTRSVQRSQ